MLLWVSVGALVFVVGLVWLLLLCIPFCFRFCLGVRGWVVVYC